MKVAQLSEFLENAWGRPAELAGTAPRAVDYRRL
jgi:hypothetical protein